MLLTTVNQSLGSSIREYHAIAVSSAPKIIAPAERSSISTHTESGTQGVMFTQTASITKSATSHASKTKSSLDVDISKVT